MLRNLALGAVLTAGVANGCDLTMTTYAESNCIVKLNSKVVTDSDEGVCTYGDAIKSYLEWKCASGKAAIDVSYYSDSGCSSEESSFAVDEGDCAKDSKTGFYFKVTGNCCGFSEPMPGSGNADEKHYRHVQMKEQMHKMMKDAFGRKENSEDAPMPGSDNADEIHYMNVRLKEATMKKLDRLSNAAQRSSSSSSSSESSSRDDIVLGGDSADEKHYRNAQMKRMVQGAVEQISEKNSHTMHHGEHMMHHGPADVAHRFAARVMGKKQHHRRAHGEFQPLPHIPHGEFKPLPPLPDGQDKPVPPFPHGEVKPLPRRSHGEFKPLPRRPHGEFKPLPHLPKMGQSSEMISEDTEETGTF